MFFWNRYRANMNEADANIMERRASKLWVLKLSANIAINYKFVKYGPYYVMLVLTDVCVSKVFPLLIKTDIYFSG